MPLERILEVEAMDTAAEAADYDAMDHSAVNRLFVDDLLAALAVSNPLVNGGCQPSDTPDALDDASPEPLDILDLGTGTALIPIELCRRTTDCRVLAVDLAVNMLELARYNIEVAGLIQRIQLARIDAKSLDFRDEQFDVVMSNSIVHHIPRPLDSLREAVRVTKTGGLLFFRDLLRPESEESLLQLVETYAGKENEHSRRMFADSLHAALTLDEVRQMIFELGFPADSVQQTSDRHWTWVGKKVDS